MHIHLPLPHLFALVRVLMCVGAVALTFGCGDKTSPVSPGSAPVPPPDASADGSTLKATAPSAVSPVNGAQPADVVVLTASKATGKFADFSPSYQFQIRSGSTVVYDSGVVGGAGSGPNNVSHTPAASSMQPETTYTWRARAVHQGAVGSWSSDATFRSPVGAYIRGSEIRDPLTIGRTVGTPVGPTQFVKDGIELLGHDSRVTYALPQTLEAGEFSVMVRGIDEGSPGDKTKVMSMQEGFDDITTNDYRFTIEKRGRQYVTPGAVTFRIINGDSGEEAFINDGFRTGVAFSDERWYFWKATWGPGFAAVEVREDGPTGRVIYTSHETTNGHAYRPQPHVIHLGAPLGRAGAPDASIPGSIYKNVWVSASPRPAFPQ